MEIEKQTNGLQKQLERENDKELVDKIKSEIETFKEILTKYDEPNFWEHAERQFNVFQHALKGRNYKGDVDKVQNDALTVNELKAENEKLKTQIKTCAMCQIRKKLEKDGK